MLLMMPTFNLFSMILLGHTLLVQGVMRDYAYRSYSEMVDKMIELNETYPEYVDLYTAQERYALPISTKLQCEYHGKNTPCLHYILRLTNESQLSPETPQVFFSGALHGDERIGPNAVMELAILLTEATTEAEHPDAWLRHLLNSRAIYLMPMTNAQGYAQNQREELDVDTNRDYNYMKSPECMETMTSRAVNELWRDQIFQLAVTFHAGMRAISYEWGSPNHHHVGRPSISPDHLGQVELTSVMAQYSGAFESDYQLYPTGTMNELVYPVTGGMEDWAYAASWENQYMTGSDKLPFEPCRPTTFGGYPEDKTRYNNVTHRALNMLIETSDKKSPAPKALGNSESLSPERIQTFLNHKTESIGHIPRNIRVALEVIEMVQPYVQWHFSSVVVSEPKSILDSECPDARPCNQLSCSAVLDDTLVFAWEVFGSLVVDATQLEMSTSRNFHDIVIVSTEQHGHTRRHWKRGVVGKEETETTSAGPIFRTCVRLTEELRSKSPKWFVRARARVDQGWATSPGDAEPHNLPPQSHVINARTNAQWRMENAEYVVQGRLDWYSPTIELTVDKHHHHHQSTPAKNVDDRTSLPKTTVEDHDEHHHPAMNNTDDDDDDGTSSPPKTKNVEVAHLASALGYTVVGVGGFFIGAVMATLYLLVFQSSHLHQNINYENVATENEAIVTSEEETSDQEAV